MKPIRNILCGTQGGELILVRCLWCVALWTLGSLAALASYPNNMPDADDEFTLQFGTQASTGVSQWFVSEPYLNLWIFNQPSTYYTSWGQPMGVALVFKQRNTRSANQPVGPGWEITGYSAVAYQIVANHYVATTTFVALGGERAYVADGVTKEFKSAGRMTVVGDWPSVPWFRIDLPDGSAQWYGGAFYDGAFAYLNYETDSAGRYTYYTWNAPPGWGFRLEQRTDWDGAVTQFKYDNAGYAVQLTRVIDPLGSTATFAYDSAYPYRLTNIVNVAGFTNSFAYDSQGLITNLVTVYGTNSFKSTTNFFGGYNLGGTNQVNRSVEITEPNGDKQLFLYRDQSTKLNPSSGVDLLPYSYPTNQVPSTGSLTNTFDNAWMDARNTFHWNAWQYSGLSTNYRNSGDLNQLTLGDYKIAQLKHWLRGYTNAAVVSGALSLSRHASPDGTSEGQKYWLDYAGKLTNWWTRGTNFQPWFSALALPDGTSRFTCTERTNAWEKLTRSIQSYTGGSGAGTRTNTMTYSSDGLDLLQLWGPTGLLISSNAYVSHQVATNYNAVWDRTIYDYNAQLQASQVRYPNSRITTNEYNDGSMWGNGRGLIRCRDYDGGSGVYLRTNQFTWDWDNLLNSTDPRGTTLYYDWNAVRQITQQILPIGTNSFLYGNLDLTNAVSPLGYNQSFVYDAMQELRVTYDPRSNSNAIGYSQGLVTSITNALGQTNGFTYDFNGRVLSKIYHDTSRASNGYNLLGQLVSQTDAAGHWISNYFNNQGLVAAVSNAFGRVFQYTYDVFDRVTNTVDVNGVSTSVTYDNLGRVLTRTVSGGGTEQYQYGPAGMIAYTNQLGLATHYGYDALGRKIAETNANSEVTRYVYSPAGDLFQLIDAKGHTNSWNYDYAGRVTNQIDATGTQIRSYTYDANGRLIYDWNRAQNYTRSYEYDANGNLWTMHYSGSPYYDQVFTYDALNRLTNMVGLNLGTNTFTYTSFGALASEDGPWDNDTLTYSYQTNHLRSALSLAQPNASPWVQSYTYDAANRLQTLTSPVGSFTYGRPNAGPLVNNLALPNGAHITNVFDSLARLTGTYLKNSAEAILNSHSYAYNSANQRTRQTRTDGSYVDYTYDNIGQLASALGKESGGASRLHETFGFGYDPAGNLSARTNNALVQSFSVDSLNQLSSVSRSGTLTVAGTTTSAATSVTVNGSGATLYGDRTFALGGLTPTNGVNVFTAVAQDSYSRSDTNSVSLNLPTPVSYTYDGNGNLTYDGNRNFTYDGLDQLASVYVTNVWKSEFVYDGRNRLRIRREWVWQGGAWVENGETHYIYDGNLVIQERDPNNLPEVTYTRGWDLSGTSFDAAGGIGGLLARTDNSAFNVAPSTASSYYHADGNGNVTMLINQEQIPVAKYLYSPCGNTIALSGSLADANVYRFSSKEFCANSGLYYFGRRFYEPNLQRWVNRDPSGAKGGPNLYAFAHNGPINTFDAWGLDVTFTTDANLASILGSIYTYLSPGSIGYDKVLRSSTLIGSQSDPVTGEPAYVYYGPNSIAPYTHYIGGLTEQLEGHGLESETPGLIGAVIGGTAIKAGVGVFWGAVGTDTVIAATIKKLTGAAEDAIDVMGAGRGQIDGTRVHTLFENEVGALGDESLATERSFLNGEVVNRGTPGSIRADVVQYDSNGKIIAVYDLKTGGATLTEARIRQIQGEIGKNVPVIEIRAPQNPGLNQIQTTQP